MQAEEADWEQFAGWAAQEHRFRVRAAWQAREIRPAGRGPDPAPAFLHERESANLAVGINITCKTGVITFASRTNAPHQDLSLEQRCLVRNRPNRRF